MLGRVIRPFFVLSFFLISTSCIAYSNHKLPNVETNNLHITPHKKTKIFASWDFGSNTISEDLKPFYPLKNAINEGKKKTIEKLITDTNCCSFIVNKESADALLEVTFFPETKPDGIRNPFEIISGLTLTIIPCWFTDEFRVFAKVTRGKDIKLYDINDSVTTINWLPLIFATPFTKKPWVLSHQTQKNVYKNLVLRMANDGLLN